MPDLEQWKRLFKSRNPDVRKRALAALLRRDDSAICRIVLDAFAEYYATGLGWPMVRWLSSRKCAETVEEMIRLLNHADPWIRAGACQVLRSQSDRRATGPLIEALSDPNVSVRIEAGHALAMIADPASASALKARYEACRDDNVNVRIALECALKATGVSFERHPY
jgi:HEAT repeat protein